MNELNITHIDKCLSHFLIKYENILISRIYLHIFLILINNVHQKIFIIINNL
jgi:hypothetical protein